MGSVSVYFSWIANVWKTGADDKRLKIMIVEILSMELVSNENVGGRPGHRVILPENRWLNVYRFCEYN